MLLSCPHPLPGAIRARAGAIDLDGFRQVTFRWLNGGGWVRKGELKEKVVAKEATKAAEQSEDLTKLVKNKLVNQKKRPMVTKVTWILR